MSRKIFIWVGHPRLDSLCAGLADAYERAARASGAQVERMDLAAMDFNSDAFDGYGEETPGLEPDLVRWQHHITWAEHLLFVHPYWWGAMPARAKSVFDRALAPGFAFRYTGQGIAWDKLLSGRTADVIVTSDTPPWYDTLVFRKPARRVMTNQVLGFCGLKTRRCVQFGPVKTAADTKIAGWMDTVADMGRKAASGR